LKGILRAPETVILTVRRSVSDGKVEKPVRSGREGHLFLLNKVPESAFVQKGVKTSKTYASSSSRIDLRGNDPGKRSPSSGEVGNCDGEER